ncbi:uncharacterized protein LOC107761270 [Nicotiana tabacum]|uniref:Uncharacterized protein LOC107761270 n=1 Tax=Nicotiana tabacum TaxID=4097 RepID=A0A1S3X4X4_TOBAC|nr:PREDICTED: uncharacterized protein LOC107761270 [Nicotiana tabacum]
MRVHHPGSEKDEMPEAVDSDTDARIGDYSFNVSTFELVAILRSMGDKVRWPKEMRSSPSKRNPNFWCEFNNDHDHKTTDCRLLQGEVEHLLKQGYLTDLLSEKGKQSYMKNRQEPLKPPSPKRRVNVISGGEEVNGVTYTATKKTSKVMITHGKRVCHVLDEDSSSVNILLLRVVNKMQADDKVVPKARSLSGSDNSSVIMKKIMLTIFAEKVIKDTKFQVIDTDMAYNMILGRLWIHNMDVVPSTLHQVIKFPLQWGIRQIREDQQASKSINLEADSSTTNDVTNEK